MEQRINISDTDKIRNLKIGEEVLLWGDIYTARDEAHKRLCESLLKGEELPIPIKNSIIYYAGPTPPKPNEIIGSCGPTTSYRMDKYAPKLLDLGLLAMIGKGKRNQEVIDSIVRNKSVYFASIGGAGALISKSVKKSEIICYEDLGAEAIRKLYVEDFHCIVVADNKGGNLYGQL